MKKNISKVCLTHRSFLDKSSILFPKHHKCCYRFSKEQNSFKKNEPNEISYWDYKIFISNTFYDELYYAFSDLIIYTCDRFFSLP